MRAEWTTPLGALAVFEPTECELALASPLLAAFYDEPHNAALLGNTTSFTPALVVELWSGPATSFLFTRDGEVVGDGDFRNVGGGLGEVAILVGPRALQGKGLGARFLAMLLTLGFERLGLVRVFASIRLVSYASLRLFARAGFTEDDTAEGRGYADDPDDVVLSLGKARFRELHESAVAEIALV